MIKAIIFDMDDLMVNSSSLHLEASKRVFLPFGADVDDLPTEVVASFFGLRVREILEYTADYFNIRTDMDKLEGERSKIFLELIMKGLEPMPGLFKLIEMLKKRKYKYALASSGTLDYIEKVIKRLELEDFFDVVVTGSDVKEAKPEPEIFLKTAKKLAIEPRDCIVIEDAKHGVTAAKAAGMFCIAVENAMSPYKQDLSQADIVVKRLDEIDEGILAKFNKRGEEK